MPAAGERHRSAHQEWQAKFVSRCRGRHRWRSAHGQQTFPITSRRRSSVRLVASACGRSPSSPLGKIQPVNALVAATPAGVGMGVAKVIWRVLNVDVASLEDQGGFDRYAMVMVPAAVTFAVTGMPLLCVNLAATAGPVAADTSTRAMPVGPTEYTMLAEGPAGW